MSLEFYKLLHLVGLIFLFSGIGGFLALGDGNPRKAKMAVYLHGVGLILLFVSGFGMQAVINRLMDGQLGFPWWMIVKIVIWLFLGGALALAKRKVIPVRTLVIVSILVGCVAAYLGLTWRSGFGI